MLTEVEAKDLVEVRTVRERRGAIRGGMVVISMGRGAVLYRGRELWDIRDESKI